MASVNNVDISTFAFYQKDKNYRWWSSDADGWGRNVGCRGSPVSPDNQKFRHAV
jgi:sucrose porin